MIDRAKSFAVVAREYERGRPGYPAAALDWLLGSEPLDVVDLGAGTGKLTEALLAAGHRVVAVEPLAEMRERLAAAVPGAAVVGATAEDTTLPALSADAVVAGAAFHWFDTARAFPEIARVLRAPGVLGLLSNRLDVEAAEWVQRLADVLHTRGGRGRRRWPGRSELLGWFTEVDDREFANEQHAGRSTVLDLALSYSRAAVLPEPERRALLDRVAGFWDSDPDLQGRETVLLPWRTTVRRCRGLRRP